MKLSKLQNFLKKNRTANELRVEISNEVEQYKESLKTLGKSSSIYLNEDIKIKIGKDELKRLCHVFLSKELNEVEINYIANAILLSNNVTFENENILELIELLTDPEINGPLTDNVVKNILVHIK